MKSAIRSDEKKFLDGMRIIFYLSEVFDFHEIDLLYDSGG